MVVTIEMTYFQVCSKETDYMPSFHGGYYRDDRNTKVLTLDQRKNEMQVKYIPKIAII